MTSAPPAEPVTTFDNANGTTQTTETATIAKAKLSAITRFKSLTSSGFRSSNTPNPTFPPASWTLSEAPDTGSGASSWSNDVERWRSDLERWRDQVKTGFSPSIPPTPPPHTPAVGTVDLPDTSEQITLNSTKGKGRADSPQVDQEDTKDSSEPTTLAMRIKNIIDENFKFVSTQKTSTSESENEATTSITSPPTSPAPSSSTTPKPDDNTENDNSMFKFAIDSKLANILSSETMMNGVEKGRESVWSVLDRMGYGKEGKGKEKDESPQQQQRNEVEEDGIMFYTPLQPTIELSPEIAESTLEDEVETSSSAVPRYPNEDNPPKPKQKRVFQPSATKLSLQCTWWGYRLFIPPPIMAQLSNAHIAAAKRGAMIAAALKWLLDKAPMMMIPPQFRPAMLLLRSFSPYLGYVGAFVAWSWGRIESKDTGNGVVLTATWLLPVAILPASWDFEAHGLPVEPTPKVKSIPLEDPPPVSSTTNTTISVETRYAEKEADTSQLHQNTESKPNTSSQQTTTTTSKAKVPLRHAASNKASSTSRSTTSSTRVSSNHPSPTFARSKSSITSTGATNPLVNSTGSSASSTRQPVRRATTGPIPSTSTSSKSSVRVFNDSGSSAPSTPRSILRPSTLAPPSPSSTKNGETVTSSPLKSILRKPSPLSDSSSPRVKEDSPSFFKRASDVTNTQLKNRTDLR